MDEMIVVEVALNIVKGFVDTLKRFGDGLDSVIIVMDSSNVNNYFSPLLKPEPVAEVIRKYTTWSVRYEPVEGGYNFVFTWKPGIATQ